MLDFGIVDSHLHIWDLGRLRYPWLDGDALLNRTYLLSDFDLARGGLPVDKLVFMQAECLPEQYLDEVRFVEEEAARDARLVGIVAFAPMELGAAAAEALDALARIPLVRGVRRLIQGESDPGFCLSPEFVAAVRLLPRYGFTFDLGVHQGQLMQIARLAERCPETSFVLDHIGKPAIRAHNPGPWRDGIRALAACPNVCCKVSSLATEADHRAWTIDDLRPYADWVFECFGFDRTMFGGDWPVSTRAASYPTCVETIQKLLPGADEAQLKRLFRANAEAFYRV